MILFWHNYQSSVPSAGCTGNFKKLENKQKTLLFYQICIVIG